MWEQHIQVLAENAIPVRRVGLAGLTALKYVYRLGKRSAITCHMQRTPTVQTDFTRGGGYKRAFGARVHARTRARRCGPSLPLDWADRHSLALRTQCTDSSRATTLQLRPGRGPARRLTGRAQAQATALPP